jgi:AcrR family transcriptional regulator
LRNTHYHHGDLRNALVLAGLDILDQDGMDGLTLRKVAARVGVSHAAPAHHFANRESLFVAIAAHGFDRFRDYMEEGRFAGGTSPREQLIGIAGGYLRFSQEQPALFRLIFNPDYKNHPDDDLQAASLRAYGVLADVCAGFEPDPAGPGINELKVWSVVHGYAMLSLFRRGQTAEGEPVPIELLLPALKPRAQP